MNNVMEDYYPAWRSANGGEDYSLWLWGQMRRATRLGLTEDAAHFKKLYQAEERRLRRY